MKRLFTKNRLLKCVLLYVVCYLVLSRIGFQWSRAAGMSGFYFVYPAGTTSCVINYGCVYFFYPLIAVDYWIGAGMSPNIESRPNDLLKGGLAALVCRFPPFAARKKRCGMASRLTDRPA